MKKIILSCCIALQIIWLGNLNAQKPSDDRHSKLIAWMNEDILNNSEFVFEGALRSNDTYIRPDNLGKKHAVQSIIINVTKVYRGKIKPGIIEIVSYAPGADSQRYVCELSGTDSTAIFFCTSNKEFIYNPNYDIYPLDNKVILSERSALMLGNEVIRGFNKNFRSKAEVYRFLKAYPNLKIPAITKADNDTVIGHIGDQFNFNWVEKSFKEKCKANAIMKENREKAYRDSIDSVNFLKKKLNKVENLKVALDDCVYSSMTLIDPNGDNNVNVDVWDYLEIDVFLNYNPDNYSSEDLPEPDKAYDNLTWSQSTTDGGAITLPELNNKGEFQIKGITPGTVSLIATYDDGTCKFPNETITVNVLKPTPILDAQVQINEENKYAGYRATLTISGDGFGDTQEYDDQGNLISFVTFTQADDGGLNGTSSYVKNLDPADYISWSNTEITMYMPGVVRNKVNDENAWTSIGSGSVFVTNSFGNGSTDNSDYDHLTITRNYSQYISNDGTMKYFGATSANASTTGAAISFNIDYFISNDERLAIERAMHDWNCALASSAEGYGTNFSLNLLANPKVNYNIVHVTLTQDQIDASNITLMQTTPCDVGFVPDGDYAYSTGRTISISNNVSNKLNWDYSLPNNTVIGATKASGTDDFYSAFLHELGHFLQLEHVNQNNDLMWWTSDPNGIRVDLRNGGTVVNDAELRVDKCVTLLNLLPDSHLAYLNINCCPAPTAPEYLQGGAISSWEIDLNWTIPTPSEVDDFNPPYYMVARSTNNPAGPFTLLTTANQINNTTNYFWDVNVNPSTTYYYQVYAQNTYGVSTSIYSAAITTPAGMTPSTVSSVGNSVSSNGSPTITWSGSGTNAKTYTVSRSSTGASGSFKPIYTTPDAHTTSYTDNSKLNPNQVYYYQITSNNPDGSTTSTIIVVFTATTPCSSTTDLNYTTTSSVPFVKYTTGTITAGTSVSIAGGKAIEFLAGTKVVLNPGFSALNGSYLKAEITPCGASSTQDSIGNSSLTDIKEQHIGVPISIYPNPNNGSFMVSMTNETVSEIAVLNIYGQMVQYTTNNNAGNSFAITLPNGSKGMYFVRLKGKQKTYVQKIVVE